MMRWSLAQRVSKPVDSALSAIWSNAFRFASLPRQTGRSLGNGQVDPVSAGLRQVVRVFAARPQLAMGFVGIEEISFQVKALVFRGLFYHLHFVSVLHNG